MNKKVQNAAAISKKHKIGGKSQPDSSQLPPIRPIRTAPSNTYLFELTESMINDGFEENQVLDYIQSVESLSKKSDSEIDQYETTIIRDLKKINKEIRQMKDPKPEQEPIPQPIQEIPEEPDPPSSLGYAEIHKSRGNSHSPTQSPVKPVPKKVVRKEEDPKPAHVDVQAVQTTESGAKFVADLLSGLGGDDDEGSNGIIHGK